MSSEPEVIVVDDDQAVRRSLQMLLRGHGFRVKAYPDATSIANDPEARSAALLVADYRMPGGSGFEVLRRLRSDGWRGAAILVTGYNDAQTSRDAAAEGFEAVLDKPYRANLVLKAARAATGR